jgi:hypothetical protein
MPLASSTPAPHGAYKGSHKTPHGTADSWAVRFDDDCQKEISYFQSKKMFDK